MKKKSDEIPAIFTIKLPEQVEVGKPTAVLLKVAQKPRAKAWRGTKEIQGAVKVERWCAPQCYSVAQTIIDRYGSTERYSAETPLPSMNFQPEVLEMVDLLIEAVIGPEKKLLKRAQNAEEERQNKLREKLPLTIPKPTLPQPTLADDALIQIKHALSLALEPNMARAQAMATELRSYQSQIIDKDLQIRQFLAENRQLNEQCEVLHNDLMKFLNFISKALHDLDVIKSHKDQRARSQHPPKRRLFKLGHPANNKGEQEPAFVDLKLVATYRSEVMELIRRYQTDPDLIRTKKAANE